MPECTCDRDDDSWVGEPVEMPLCPYHEKRLRHLSWETLASLVIDYEAALRDEAANTYDEQLAVATWNDALDSAGAAVDALAQSHGGRNPLLAYTDIIEALFSQRRIVAALDKKSEAQP